MSANVIVEESAAQSAPGHMRRSTAAPCGLTGLTPLTAAGLGLALLPQRRRRSRR